MRTGSKKWLLLCVLVAALSGASALAQPDSPATDLKSDPDHPGQAISKAAKSDRPVSPNSISPAAKPSTADLATRNVVPLPSTGGAGVAPPALPGAPNSASPGAGSKP